ncbi:MAG: hypothetical protein OEW60_05845 [Thiovulaceae bacterium]|nr:hypothetical protein [Sulfurimonadaceae bacterium]
MKKILSVTALFAALVFQGCSSGPSVAGAPANVKAYLVGNFDKAKSVEKKLKANGFEILATTKVGKKKMPVIIFTSPAIKKLADRPMRGLLAGSMRIMVDKERNVIKANNPMYFFKAFLQDQYKPGDEKSTVTALLKAFPSLSTTVMGKDEDGEQVDTNSENLEYDDIPDYHYIIGMPYYHDQNELGRGDSVAGLVKKIEKNAKKKKALVYTTKLSENRYVIGVHLSKRTSKFPKKIGEQNSLLLPWQILVEEIEEDGKKEAIATALDGKYRIALSYPQLSMVGAGSFAGIMSVPGALEDDLKKYCK